MNADPLARELGAIVGPANLRSGDAMAPHLTDWRGRYTGRARLVVLPGDTQEVAAVVRACAAARVPIVPQGGNTGLVGGATPDGAGTAVVLCLRRMNHIVAVDAANNTITIEAGCLLAAVQAAAAAERRLFPLSLAAEGSCTIGGNIATNAGGVHVVRYGVMRELVLGLEVVLADGEIWNGLRGLRKDNTGYDLKQLFIGSEGTLGVVTRAVLKLYPLPTAQATAWLGADSPAALVEIFCSLQARLGARLVAFEMLSRAVLDVLFKHFPEAGDPLPGTPWVALVQLEDGGSEAVLRTTLEAAVGDEIAAGRAGDAVIAHSLAQAERLWWLREHAPEAEKRDGISVKHDIALPVSALPDFIASAEPALQQAFPGAEILCFGHLGDGNLHYNVRHRDPLQNAEFLTRQDAVNRLVYDLVNARGGSISAEHGIGQLKARALLDYKSAPERRLMQAIKTTIDPNGIMNPGKLLVDSRDPP
ncbi:MAG TPA: FAD-binding oxidoreductase [Rhodocyclaceae bacterium]|nr:FAD-binding oxidoreductase [Rhodocyclaceae bacterium]